MTIITRRTALIAAGLAAAPIPAWARDLPAGQFTHGVASGDPLSTAVVIWTRFAPASGAYGEIGWEVAEDEAFARVAARGRVLARGASDFCAKVDVQGLRPGRRYYYRFLSGSGPSPTGMTMTAPVGRTRALKLALFSCSNFGFGYFHAYAHAAADPSIDLVVHVGDYIYEYGQGSYPSDAQTVPGRQVESPSEIATLEQYYARYQTYRSDAALQELHRLKPWVTVWDDHELTNDAWVDGAENHQPDTEGTWPSRFAHAWKAYLDWMPIRTGATPVGGIYRSFAWGDLAGIAVLDTRWVGRERPFDYAEALAPVMDRGMPAIMAAVGQLQAQVAHPDRTLLGAEQEAWLARETARFADAAMPWTILAQQIVMAPLIAAPQIPALLPDDAPSFVRQFATAGAMLGQAGLEWNLDAWSGYPAARRRVIEQALASRSNTIVLSGDSHNCWVSDISGGPNGLPALVELAGTSVTSPGLEAYLTRAEPGQREAIMQGANEGLVFADLTHKGYATLSLTRQTATADIVRFSGWRDRAPPEPSIARLVSEAVRGAGVGGWTPA
jgi:alkaline phosphatase D